MKKYILLILCFLPALAWTQAEMTPVAETLPIHDHQAKIDMTLYDRAGAKYIGIKLHTIFDLGCLNDSSGLIFYLGNGAEVDCFLEEAPNCGKMVDNKGKFGGKVNRHAEYDLFFLVDADDLEDLRTHDLTAMDIEGEHLTIERKAEDFQKMSRDKFSRYLKSNLLK
jgi:hypothetical protein